MKTKAYNYKQILVMLRNMIPINPHCLLKVNTDGFKGQNWHNLTVEMELLGYFAYEQFQNIQF